jgi:hypothetical protein
MAATAKYVLTGSADNTARLWGITYHDTIRALCERLLRDLSAEERGKRRPSAMPVASPTIPPPTIA